MFKHILILILTVFITVSCSVVKEVTGDVSGMYASRKNTSVVIVGMRNSRAFGQCVGSDVDASTMQKILKKYSSHVTVLRDQQATKSAVIAALTQATKSDLMIFYYSGHGGSQRQSSSTKANFVEPSGNDSYLCLYDAKMLDDEIWGIIQSAKGRVVFIADCCHSGTMFRSPINFEQQINAMSANSQERGHKTQLYYVGGCTDQTYSYGDNNGGLMTNSIKKWFDSSDSYDTLFKRVRKDYSVSSSEAVQIVEIGSSFKNYLVFR